MRFNSENPERKSNVRRTTIMLTVIAVAFYLGFIMIGVMRA